MTGRLRTDADHYVAHKVRTFRQERDLSQKQLADALGVSFQQVQKYERGTNRITAGRLHALAAILNVRIDQFFEGMPASKRSAGEANGSTAAEFIETAEGLQLARAFMKIKDRRKRQQLLLFVKSLAEPDVLD